jgi:peptide/nickel transport system permease protein
MWVEVARVTRGQILSVREKEYVEAARALGFSDFRIIFRHILPNVSGPIIVIAAANFASAILIEAGLSFLGIGIQPPMPSWGSMIRENYAYLLLDEAHLAILPGMAIMMIVLSFMILGNGLRDAFDVKAQKVIQA